MSSPTRPAYRLALPHRTFSADYLYETALPQAGRPAAHARGCLAGRSPNGHQPPGETLTYDPDQSGRCDELDDVIDEPADPAFVATALGWDGAVIGSGSGTTIAEAMLRVYRRRVPFPDLGDTGVYSGEPPF
jgi:hypothetical protein